MLLRVRRAFLMCLTAVPLIAIGASVSGAEDVVCYFTSPPQHPVSAADILVCTARPLDPAQTQCSDTEYAVQQVVVIPGYGGPYSHPYVTEVILYGRSNGLGAGTRLVNPLILIEGESCPAPCRPVEDLERWPDSYLFSDCSSSEQNYLVWQAQVD